MSIDQETAELNAMLARARSTAAQERNAARKRIDAAAGTDSISQVVREEAATIEYFTGRHDAHDFVLEDMEANLHPEDLVSFLDQALTNYIADADSLQKVKGFSSVVTEVNDFRLSL